MTIDNINILHKKAETKKDGVYSFRGVFWAVKSNKFVAYVNERGLVLQRFGCFDAKIGDLSKVNRYEWRGEFIKFFKKI